MPDLPSNGSITLSGWGATLRIFGRDIVVVLSLFAVVATMILDRRDRGIEQLARQAEHLAIIEAQKEVACMLAVPTEPREYRLEAAQDRQGACHYIATIYQYRNRPIQDRLRER